MKSDNAEKIVLTDCVFSNSKNPCISIWNSRNVTINNCHFSENFNGCVISDDRCVDVDVIGNSFCNNGKGWMNSFNVSLSGENFRIANNKFSDFNYGAIAVGNWFGNPKNGRVTGVVEYNEIFYSPVFYKSYEQNTLMDSGAIYVFTMNDSVVIRYNRIYDIIGIKDNRGIFCDDGTCNTKIIGNVITGIANSYCIDLRYVPKVENHERYSFGKVNVGNVLAYNFVDGICRFEGRKENEESNGCIKEINYILHKKGNPVPDISLRNIYNSNSDSIFQIKCVDGGLIDFDESSKNALRMLPIIKEVDKWIR